MKYPAITIVIPNLHGEKKLPFCIQSILKQNYPGRIQIIVVDNNSSDKSVEVVKKKFPAVKLVELSQNIGFAASFNLGIIEAEGEIIATGNNDAIYHPNCFREIIKTFQNDQNVSLAGPKILKPRPSHNLGITGIHSNPYLAYLNLPLAARNQDQIQEATWLSGCTLFIKKEVIEKIGPLDDGIFFYFEDTDFCSRALRAGYKLIYNPKAILWHGIGASASEKEFPTREKSYYWYKSKFRCLIKNSTLFQAIISLLIQLLAISYKNLVLNDETLSPFIWAAKDTLDDLPSILRARHQSNKLILLARKDLLPSVSFLGKRKNLVIF